MEIIITEEEKRNKLLEKFLSLNNVTDKLLFWENEIGQDYSWFHLLHSKYYKTNSHEYQFLINYKNFIIFPKAGEIASFNTWMTDKLKTHRILVDPFLKIMDFDELRRNYLNEVEEKEDDIELYLEDRIQKVDESLNDIRFSIEIEPNNERNKLYLVGYRNQIRLNGAIDLTKNVYDYIELILLINGSAHAKFETFLKSELELFKSSPKKKKIRPTSLQQQILMLQFLGVFEKIDAHKNATDKRIFLNALLNKTPQTFKEIYAAGVHSFKSKNERKARPDIESDLKAVYDLFKLVGLNEIAKEIQTEIAEL